MPAASTVSLREQTCTTRTCPTRTCSQTRLHSHQLSQTNSCTRLRLVKHTQRMQRRLPHVHTVSSYIEHPLSRQAHLCTMSHTASVIGKYISRKCSQDGSQAYPSSTGVDSVRQQFTDLDRRGAACNHLFKNSTEVASWAYCAHHLQRSQRTSYHDVFVVR